jgi:photosynthetic reaction center cytochrome c subunit
MPDQHRRPITVVAGVAGILALAITWLTAQSAPSQTSTGDASSTPKTTEQVYKNIKVLKGIPASQLIPAMQFVAASLGVKCDHCHAEGHFDSDEKKPKETARKMMTMMFAINKDNFDNQRKVTCNTCHRGSAKPVATAVISATMQMMAMPENEAAQPDVSMLPTASDLIDKYVQAAGGAAAIEKITSRVEKGTTTGFGHAFPTEAFYKAPDQGAVFTHFPNGEGATTFNGHEGWLAFPGRPKHPLEGADFEAAKMDSDLHFPVDLNTMFSEFKAAASQKIGEQQAFQILGSRPGQPPVELYFDEQSGLLVRLVRYAESPLGLYPTQIDFADYRDQQGVKIPFRITTSHPGSSSTLQVDQVQQNVPVDDSKFSPPGGDSAPHKP